MTTFEFQGQNFSMEGSAKTFIEKYLSRIQKYAENHAISEEVVDDLYQGIFEKLCAFEGNITQKELVDLVNSLGEPEDIFEEEINHSPREKEEKSDLKPYEKWQKTKRTRPQDLAVFLGVCAMIGNVTGIHRRIWRIVVIIMSGIFLWSRVGELFLLECVGYLLLALIFPITDKNYNHRSTLKYGITQIRDLRLWFKNFFFRCLEIGTKVIGSSLKIVKYGFLSLRCLFLFALMIAGSIFVYFLCTGFVRDKVDYSSFFPGILKIGVLLGIVSAFFLFLWAFWGLIKKKIAKIWMILLGIFCGLGAVVVCVITFLKMYGQFHPMEYEDYSVETHLTLEKSPDLQIIRIVNPTIPEYIRNYKSLNIFESESDEIVAKIHFDIAKMEGKEKVKSLIAQPEIAWKDGEIVISFPENSVFSDVVPFVPMRRDVELYVPRNLIFHLNTEYWHALNTEMPEWTKKYGWSNRDCDKIYWKESVGNFYCEMQPSLDGRELEHTLEDYADTIVPLQGFELSWSQNGMSRATETYWHVDSIQKKGHQDYLVKFSDTFFNFFIEVEYVFDTDGNFHITSQKLIQMEQKGLMDAERMANYAGWENLSWFDLKMKETPKNPEDYEQRISALEKKMDLLEMKLWE